MSNPNIAAMVASRICHDLINPVGAIANGVELLELTGRSDAELDLISDGVQHTSARVRFFRVAFGSSDASQTMSPRETNAIFDDRKNERISIFWNDNQARSRLELKAVFLSLLCMEVALPRGGDIIVKYQNGWSIVANAEIVDAKDEIWGPLAECEPPTSLTPNLVPFALLPETLKEIGYLPTIQVSNSRLSIHLD